MISKSILDMFGIPNSGSLQRFAVIERRGQLFPFGVARQTSIDRILLAEPLSLLQFTFQIDVAYNRPAP